MVQIAIVTPTILGGVYTDTFKLFKGLLLEGFNVKLVRLQNLNLAVKFFSDLLNTNYLEKFDVVIFIGSTPWPSHLLIKKPITALFIHGFVQDELLNSIKYGTLRVSLGAMSLLSYWKLAKALNRIDFSICHSVTTCEKNGVYEDCILLPQFVIPEEIVLHDSFNNGLHKYKPQENRIRVLTYSSFANSPRLLKSIYIASFMKKVSIMVNKEIEFVMIDPKRKIESVEHIGKLTIRGIKYMPKKEFLSYLADSDLYIERCIDEELGYGAIEAGLCGTPVAKITHSSYIARQDYTDKQILMANSSKDFIYKIVKYIKYIDDLKPHYSKEMKAFISKYRSWSAVKFHLIKRLNEEI